MIEKYKVSWEFLFIGICSWDKGLSTGDWMRSNRKTKPGFENVKPQGIFQNWLITSDQTSYPYVCPFPHPHMQQKRKHRIRRNKTHTEHFSGPIHTLSSWVSMVLQKVRFLHLPGTMDAESRKISNRHWVAALRRKWQTEFRSFSLV